MAVTMSMRIKGLLEALITGAAAVAVIILTPQNPIAEEITLLYIIGVAFGLVFWGLLSRMVKKEDYPLPDTPRKTVSVVRWICFAATILIGIILVLLFAGGFAITANGVPIIKTLTAFFIGDVIGAILIGLTLDFKATRYDFYRLTNLLTGKKSE